MDDMNDEWRVFGILGLLVIGNTAELENELSMELGEDVDANVEVDESGWCCTDWVVVAAAAVVVVVVVVVVMHTDWCWYLDPAGLRVKLNNECSLLLFWVLFRPALVDWCNELMPLEQQSTLILLVMLFELFVAAVAPLQQPLVTLLLGGVNRSNEEVEGVNDEAVVVDWGGGGEWKWACFLEPPRLEFVFRFRRPSDVPDGVRNNDDDTSSSSRYSLLLLFEVADIGVTIDDTFVLELFNETELLSRTSSSIVDLSSFDNLSNF